MGCVLFQGVAGLHVLISPNLQTDVQEYPIPLLAITVAQRYSVLVTARNDTSSNFVIHANME